MRDLYLWFYLKNIGLPFLALLLALFEKKPRWRRLFAMALPIILAAEFIRFQPNEYDNNKLFYLAWLICCMIARTLAGFVRKNSPKFFSVITETAVSLSSATAVAERAVFSNRPISPK